MTKNHETGRSMVEMLGVLAVIGVLSIGGIAGYSYGMDKYRANETIQDVNLRMMDLMTQLNNHPDSDPNISNEWGTKGAFYPMDVVYDYETLEYALEVSDVPKQVCKMVFDGLISSYSIEIGTVRYVGKTEEVCGDNNVMAFYLDTVESRQCLNIICNKGQYCTDTNEEWLENPSGVCEDLGFSEYIVNNVSYYISDEPMTYLDTKSACRALTDKDDKKLGMFEVQELITKSDGSPWAGETTNSGMKLTPLAEQLFSLSGKIYLLGGYSGNAYRVSKWTTVYRVPPNVIRSGKDSYDYYGVCR